MYQVIRYEMVIHEEPVKIVQVVTFDESAGLRIVEVPKHLNLMKTLHITSLNDDRLTLQVYEEVETCYIGKPHHHLNAKEEKEALGNFTATNSPFNKMFSSSQAVRDEYIFLPGAYLTHSELPPKLREYCPTHYKIQTFRYVSMDSQVVTVSESGEMIVQDPDIQRDYKDGDYIIYIFLKALNMLG